MTTDPVAREFRVTIHCRRARKWHYCGGCNQDTIRPGDIYLMHTEFPGGESGYADSAGHPVRAAECRSCAVWSGRAGFFDLARRDEETR